VGPQWESSGAKVGSRTIYWQMEGYYIFLANLGKLQSWVSMVHKFPFIQVLCHEVNIKECDFHVYMKTLIAMIMYLIIMVGMDFVHESIIFNFMC
jgi:hypothetical protein